MQSLLVFNSPLILEEEIEAKVDKYRLLIYSCKIDFTSKKNSKPDIHVIRIKFKDSNNTFSNLGRDSLHEKTYIEASAFWYLIQMSQKYDSSKTLSMSNLKADLQIEARYIFIKIDQGVAPYIFRFDLE